MYREDRVERGGFEVRESGAGIEDHAALARSVDGECAVGIVHFLAGDGDARDGGVVEGRVNVVGDHGRVGHASGDGRVADVERARLGAAEWNQAVGEFLRHDAAELRNERQRAFAKSHEPARAGKRAEVAVAAAEGYVRDRAVSDGDGIGGQSAACGRAVAVKIIILAARRARFVRQIVALVASTAEGFVGPGLGGVEFGAVGSVTGLAGQALHPVQVASSVHYGRGSLRRRSEGNVHNVFSISGLDWRGEQSAAGEDLLRYPGAAFIAPLHSIDEDFAEGFRSC